MERIPIVYRKIPLIMRTCELMIPSWINLPFRRLAKSRRQVGYVLLTRAPVAIFPAIATVTMFASYFITQKLSGMDAQMQGSMKVMMLVMNLMFVTFCFNAPVGFSLYYGVSNVVQIFQSYVTYKIYSPEKFKAQYEAELAAKRAEKKKKRTVTVEQNGKQVEKEVTLGEANKLRLEMARQREAELYKDERTTPLNKD